MTDDDTVRETIERIWCEVLSLPSVTPDENFFDIGGHSLLIPVVAMHIEERLGPQLPIRLIFEHATVAELATLVRSARG